tara:strand:- start:80430 stop:80627 length:198 start_codon:yes stop_codon:yes gene_type:complete
MVITSIYLNTVLLKITFKKPKTMLGIFLGKCGEICGKVWTAKANRKLKKYFQKVIGLIKKSCHRR